MESKIKEALSKLKKYSGKIKRDAFLYQDPKGNNKQQFAQCSTCIMFTGNTCTIHGREIKITGDMSCGLYVNGRTDTEGKGHEMESVTVEESGLVKRQVRCENCKFFNLNKRHCELFEHLTEAFPDIFDLDKNVNKYGCCNANTRK